MPAKKPDENHFPFTIASLKALPLPPAGERPFYYDTETPGLAARHSASGELVFYLYRKVAGDPVKVALGPFDPALPASREIPRGVDPLDYIGNRPRLNPRMARTLVQAVGIELAKGSNPAGVARIARRKRDGELTITQGFEQYERDHLLHEGKRSVAALRAVFERYVGALPEVVKRPRGRERTKSPHGVDWSRRRLSAIAQTDVSDLQGKLKEGHGAHTSNRVFELLNAMYNWLIKNGRYDGKNPCAGLSKYKVKPRKRFLRSDESPKFFTAWEELPEGAFKDLVALLLYAALRLGNGLGLRWDQVDLHAGVVTIPDETSKSGEAMTLPLTPRALAILERRRKAAPGDAVFVFPSANSASGHMTKPTKAWAAFVKSAGLTDFRRHDLRRTAGSWAAMTGASLPVIGKALGHKNSASTEVYAHLQVDPALAALHRAQDAMAAAAAGPAAQVHDLAQRRRTRRTRR